MRQLFKAINLNEAYSCDYLTSKKCCLMVPWDRDTQFSMQRHLKVPKSSLVEGQSSGGLPFVASLCRETACQGP